MLTPSGMRILGTLGKKPIFRNGVAHFERYRGRCRLWLTFNEINNMSTNPWVAAGVDSADEGVRARAAYHEFVPGTSRCAGPTEPAWEAHSRNGVAGDACSTRLSWKHRSHR